MISGIGCHEWRMSALGQNRKSSRRAYVFRFTPESGLKSDIPLCPYCANTGSRGIALELAEAWRLMGLPE